VPDDGVVSAIYGIYLHKMGEHEAALEEYLRAEEIGPQTAELAYNMGLLYFDTGDFDKAREYAAKARDGGYPLQGLQRKLKRVETESANAGPQAKQAR
jgi:tetratricopeptide (TPR) repeat protein